MVSTRAGAFLVALIVLTGCAPPLPRGVLLISIDTLRADALEAYGYVRPTSPFLRQFSVDAAVFEQAFCPLPGTLPSHMSMLTGLYPEEHGVFPPDGVLSTDVSLASEIFQAAGFRTFGSTEGGYVHGGYGFARGFDEWSHEARHKENDVEETLARTLRFLESLGKDERFFAFVHSYVVHDPYFPPDRYAGDFWKERPVPTLPPLTGPHLAELNRSERSLTPVEIHFLRARYDAQIRYLDDQLRAFFLEIGKLGLAEDLLVVITSDHGEEFREHGRLLHTQLYRECLQVPLIIKDPRQRGGRRISAIAEIVDLLPTLLELAGLPPEPRLSGESLAPWVLGRSSPTQVTSPAYAVSVDRASRSVVLEVDGAHYQLLRFSPTVTDGHVYVADQFRFDHLGSTLRLGVASLGRPRTLRVQIDGQSPTFERIGSGWDGRMLEFELGSSSYKHEVRLAGAGCRDEAGRLRAGCFLFQLVNDGFERFELYDLVRDPAGARDLSARERRTFARLRAELDRWKPAPRAATGTLDDPELRARLRALGYLQ